MVLISFLTLIRMLMKTVNPSAQECFSKSSNSVVTMRAEDIVFTKATLGIP